jgi:hypothetical protein
MPRCDCDDMKTAASSSVWKLIRLDTLRPLAKREARFRNRTASKARQRSHRASSSRERCAGRGWSIVKRALIETGRRPCGSGAPCSSILLASPDKRKARGPLQHESPQRHARCRCTRCRGLSRTPSLLFARRPVGSHRWMGVALPGRSAALSACGIRAKRVHGRTCLVNGAPLARCSAAAGSAANGGMTRLAGTKSTPYVSGIVLRARQAPQVSSLMSFQTLLGRSEAALISSPPHNALQQCLTPTAARC